jgi:hypothetical protein
VGLRRPSFFRALRPKTRSLLCVSMALFLQGRDRVFLPGHTQKLGLFSAFRWLRSSRGETEFFFTHATPEKLGLFSAYRWLCSSRRETEFFCLRHTRKTRSLLCFSMALFFQGRDRVFSLRRTRKTRSLLCLSMALFFQGRDRVFFTIAAPEKLGLFSAFR